MEGLGMKLKYILLILLNIFLLLFLIDESLLIKLDSFKYQLLKEHSIHNINYDSRNKELPVRKFYEPEKSTINDIHINFDMKVYAISNNYDNIFQTDNENFGIRFELSKYNKLGAILMTGGSGRDLLGFSYSNNLTVIISKKDKGNLYAFHLMENVKFNKWYSFDIKVKKGRYVEIDIDGKTVLKFFDKRNDFNINSQKIAIGKGFNDQRIFDGAIRNFNINYSVFKEKDTLSIKFLAFLCSRRIIEIFMYLVFGFSIFLCFLKISKYFVMDGEINNYRLNFLTEFVLIGMYLFLFMFFLSVDYKSYAFPMLFVPSDRFMDFFNVNFFMKNLNPYLGSDTSYPPFALLFAYPFSKLANYNLSYASNTARTFAGNMSFYIFIMMFISVMFSFLYKNIKLYKKSLILFFSLPVLFLIDRGNYLIFSFMFLYMFITFYHNPKFKNLSLIFLALAISLKIYPIVFLLLLLSDRRYKDILKVLFFTTILSVIPLLFFKGGFVENLIACFNNIVTFSGGYVNPLLELIYTISFQALFKIPTMLFSNGLLIYDFSFYSNLILLFGWLLIAFFVFFEKSFFKKVLIITIASIFLIPISYIYNLIYLFIPIMLFLKTKEEIKNEKFYLIFLGLLLIPKSYYVLLKDETYFITIQELINPLILFSFLVLYCFDFMKERSRNVKRKN